MVSRFKTKSDLRNLKEVVTKESDRQRQKKNTVPLLRKKLRDSGPKDDGSKMIRDYFFDRKLVFDNLFFYTKKVDAV